MVPNRKEKMENQTQQKTVMYPLDENTTWLIKTLTDAMEHGIPKVSIYCTDNASDNARLFLLDVLQAFDEIRAYGIRLETNQVDQINQIDCIIREHGSGSLKNKEAVTAEVGVDDENYLQ